MTHHSFQFEMVIFYHRVAEKLVARFVNLSSRSLPVGAVQLDFQVFTDVDRVDAPIAQLFQGVLDGFTLGINDGLLRGNDDFGFHVGAEQSRETAAVMLGKVAVGRQFFLTRMDFTPGNRAATRSSWRGKARGLHAPGS